GAGASDRARPGDRRAGPARARGRRRDPRLPRVRPGGDRRDQAPAARRDGAAAPARPARAPGRRPRRPRGAGGPGRVPGEAEAAMGPGLKRVLIANRGEIAVRIARACRELGIEAVAAYERADRGSLHVAAADHAVEVASYLDAEELVAAAAEADADAVHPGYGFLAESPEFAEAVAAAKLVFVGPPPSALRAAGDKIEARRLAEAVGIPVTPGYAGVDLEDETLETEAVRLGF